MTREESIDRLRAISEKTPIRTNGDDLVAITRAIQALSQEPCDDAISRGVFEQVMWERDIAIEQLHELGYEWGQKIEPCDDAISRKAVLELAKFDGRKGLGSIIHAFDVEQLLTVTQKSGEWLTDEIIHNGCKYTVTYCSECEEQVDYRTPFCPNCGAKMESEESE